jgi:cytochrome c oxidase assembly protein Cox11
MSLRLKNDSGRDVSVRVTHVIEPKDAAPYLVFLQCPLLLPLKIPPRESQEISSSFMIAGNAPEQMRDFQVTFAFRRVE